MNVKLENHNKNNWRSLQNSPFVIIALVAGGTLNYK